VCFRISLTIYCSVFLNQFYHVVQCVSKLV
jgi:hypothetical protein